MPAQQGNETRTIRLTRYEQSLCMNYEKWNRKIEMKTRQEINHRIYMHSEHGSIAFRAPNFSDVICCCCSDHNISARYCCKEIQEILSLVYSQNDIAKIRLLCSTTINFIQAPSYCYAISPIRMHRKNPPQKTKQNNTRKQQTKNQE